MGEGVPRLGGGGGTASWGSFAERNPVGGGARFFKKAVTVAFIKSAFPVQGYFYT